MRPVTSHAYTNGLFFPVGTFEPLRASCCWYWYSLRIACALLIVVRTAGGERAHFERSAKNLGAKRFQSFPQLALLSCTAVYYPLSLSWVRFPNKQDLLGAVLLIYALSTNTRRPRLHEKNSQREAQSTHL